MYSPEALESFFKSLATQHPDILHQEADGKHAFQEDALSDIIEGVFKTALKPEGFSMRFISPIDYPFSDDTHGLLTRVHTGFCILKRCDPTDDAAIKQAGRECHRIIKECIARIIYESRLRNPLFGGSLNQLSEGQFSNDKAHFKGDGSWFGYICLFQFLSEYIDDIDQTVSLTHWADL